MSMLFPPSGHLVFWSALVLALKGAVAGATALVGLVAVEKVIATPAAALVVARC